MEGRQLIRSCVNIRLASEAIVNAGLVALTFGNASEVDREAGVVAIKSSGVSERLDDDAIVIVELETGKAVGRYYGQF